MWILEWILRSDSKMLICHWLFYVFGPGKAAGILAADHEIAKLDRERECCSKSYSYNREREVQTQESYKLEIANACIKLRNANHERRQTVKV